MPLKGKIQEDHNPLNKFSLRVLGMPEITFTRVSGIEDELETATMPDRTQRSGGNRLPFEFEADQPMHHRVERAAMELWFRQSQDPVIPGYKKAATLVFQSASGLSVVAYTLLGVFPSKRALPEADMENEGEGAIITWTLKGDDILPSS